MKKPGRTAIAALVLSVGLTVFFASCALPPAPDGATRQKSTQAPNLSNESLPEERTPVARPPAIEGPLSEDDAVRLALTYHPELAAARARVEAAIGRKIDAGTFPNPVFAATMEMAPFSGRTTGEAEYPVGITQTLPIGGRLDRAESVEAARERRLVVELERQSREVARRARGAFAFALFQRDTLAVERELFSGAEEAAQIARERVALGDASVDEKAWAELEAARARISLRRAELTLRRALLELQGALGHESLAVRELEGKLEVTLSLPELETVLARLEESPLLRVQVAAIEESQAEILKEEANRIPDIDLGFFYRRLQETDENAFDVGVSLPLPLFDRRQGALKRARAELLEAEANYRHTSRSLRTAVQSIYWKLSQGLETARLFREELTPRSDVVLHAAEWRYSEGEVSLGDLIPIRRERRELQLTYLDILRQIAIDWAEFRSLIDTPN